MAKISMTGLDELQEQMAKASDSVNAICKKTVYIGAGILADAIRENLGALPKKTDRGTGDLERSLYIGKIENNSGVVETEISFTGYDKNGHPNALKATALESGTSKQKKTPFIRPAVKRVKETVQKSMRETVENELKKIIE